MDKKLDDLLAIMNTPEAKAAAASLFTMTDEGLAEAYCPGLTENEGGETLSEEPSSD